MPEELIPIAFIVSIAAVMILRPLTKRLGLLIESLYSNDSREGSRDQEILRLTGLVERMADRLERLEDRVDFAERVLDARPWSAADPRELGRGRARDREDGRARDRAAPRS